MIRKGFTLIELLIVMAVIAILVGIAVPAFRGMRQEAQTTRGQGDLAVLKIALESYYRTNGAYPAAAGYQATLLAASPRILERTLNDPFNTGNPYGYALSTNGDYYIVYSVGPNNGTASVTSAGVVTAGAGVIWVSNGSL